jgi:hypothetical protein
MQDVAEARLARQLSEAPPTEATAIVELRAYLALKARPALARKSVPTFG